MQRVLLSLLILLACLATRPVYATCANPAGNEADVIYNANYHTYQFCNGTNWIAYGGAAGVGGALTLISTQTASSSASLSWTGLGSTYITYLLDCNGMQPVTNSVQLLLQFGEGSTPTWVTSSYRTAETYQAGSGNTISGASNGGNSGVGLDSGGVLNGSSYVEEVKAWISNIQTSGVYHMAYGQSLFMSSINPWTTIDEFEGFGGDTNAITALRVLYSSGNISSGQCSLYGLNH